MPAVERSISQLTAGFGRTCGPPQGILSSHRLTTGPQACRGVSVADSRAFLVTVCGPAQKAAWFRAQFKAAELEGFQDSYAELLTLGNWKDEWPSYPPNFCVAGEPTLKKETRPLEFIALKVHQWLPEWSKVQFTPRALRRKPDASFYLFSMRATYLKALSGIFRRTTQGGAGRLGIQRRHDTRRSDEIRRFVQYGYPWSELSESRRKSGRFENLRKPGWLPTAIVVNILKLSDQRRTQTVDPADIVELREIDAIQATVKLPHNFSSESWQPKKLHPIEVIDGQHRLWAFEDAGFAEDFELPVVAFHGLDVSWQAYLFWTINIKPKRINPSLAFDLYPLLRTEDWLERFEGPAIYRETRAQELTESLWAHPRSPWCNRINMLGDPGMGMVTQAAWVRSLMATYVKSAEGRGVVVGGLFGAPVGKDELLLPWSGAQQAAFLMLVWQEIKQAVEGLKGGWASSLRSGSGSSPKSGLDAAFAGEHSLLNTDQGVRGVLYITNDLCFILADELKLSEWTVGESASAVDEAAATVALNSLQKQAVAGFLEDMAQGLASYDWRTASAAELSPSERTAKLVFRGSGGYRELRQQLLTHLARADGRVARIARQIRKKLGYD